jgi:hypothetical protein
LDTVKGLTKFSPHPSDLNQDPEILRQEAEGCFLTAKRAFEAIKRKVELGEKPPTVILTDIELEAPGEEQGMNGLKFVRQVSEWAKAKGLDIKVFMVYSSNPGPYMREVEELERAGVITRAFDKKTLNTETLKQMVEAINGRLDKNR